ncbi:MAG: type III-B CRISPR module-associated protein Cmr5 [Verrucomicrobiae bacterium]|nr:type III-B CRISPR module-associated protein Cmr5 [Verrucomicrobiae bacterium]
MSAPPPVESLEDVRARHAQRFWGASADAADAACWLPSLILTHGLLATLVFAKSRGGASRAVMLEVCRFLCEPERAVLPSPSGKQESDDELDPYIRLLTDGPDATSLRLRRATAEAVAYLVALRHLAPKTP